AVRIDGRQRFEKSDSFLGCRDRQFPPARWIARPAKEPMLFEPIDHAYRRVLIDTKKSSDFGHARRRLVDAIQRHIGSRIQHLIGRLLEEPSLLDSDATVGPSDQQPKSDEAA